MLIGMNSEAPARYRRSNTESRSPQSRHPTAPSLMHSVSGISLHERTSSALVQSRNSHPPPCACARIRNAASGNPGVSPRRNDNASNRRQPPPIIYNLPTTSTTTSTNRQTKGVSALRRATARRYNREDGTPTTYTQFGTPARVGHPHHQFRIRAGIHPVQTSSKTMGRSHAA